VLLEELLPDDPSSNTDYPKRGEMQSTRYLIVGGGMTAAAAVKGIREADPEGRIVLVGDETHPPYKRPPLSKKLWAGGEEAKIWHDLSDTGVEHVLGRRIVSLDLGGKTATDDAGEEYQWEKLLLATGGRPRTIPGAEGVVYFRTLDDYRRLRDVAGEGTEVVVIGGGFIGSEIAAALAGVGCRVTMAFPEPGITSRLLPPSLSSFVTGYYRDKGVEVLTGETVASVTRNGDSSTVTLGSGVVLDAATVVAGLGIEPAVELAEAAGLPVDNGILVDEYGRAGRDDVFAAGDVASFPVAALGRRMRVEHEDHANSHGRAVGANMAGAGRPYDHLPFFYSDMFDLGYEAVGELDSRSETVERWEEPNRKGVVAYVDGESRPRGFLLWDTWGKVDEARALIEAGEPVDAERLLG
jgi:NADPH-dependent 2,4-dienoyl-CoA reductase/sulfur reductase-like enzyme